MFSRNITLGLFFSFILLPQLSVVAKTDDPDEQLLEEQALSELNGTSIQRLNSMMVQEYLRRANAVSKELRQMAKLAESIHKVYEDLLINRVGQRLATRADAVLAFISIEQAPIVSAKEIDLHLARIEPIRQGIAEYATVPKLFKAADVKEIQKLAAEEAWANTKGRELQSRKQRLRALWKMAPKNIPESGLPTMKERVDSILTRMIQEELETVAAAREAGRNKAVTQTAEAANMREIQIGKKKAEQELQMMQLEIEKLKAEFKLLEARKQAEIQLTHQQVSTREKITLLENRKAIQKLRPFTAKGYWQPGSASRSASLKKEPMSFSKLEQFGALNEGHAGLSRLLAVANKTGMTIRHGSGYSHLGRIPRTYSGRQASRNHLDTDRPKWSYKSFFYQLSTEDLIRVKEVQDLLIDLGPTMVEQGMLAP